MRKFSLVQNFICTQPSRLDVVKRNSKKLGEVFPDVDFFVNYNIDNENYEPIRDSYLNNIPRMNFYNNLIRDWALVTLSLVSEVETEFVMCICEDMEVNCSKMVMDNTLNEFFDEEMDWMFLSKIGSYTQSNYIDGHTPYNTTLPPGYKTMSYGYHYLGEHAPHKRLSMDMMCRAEFFKQTLTEFIERDGNINHEIPFRKKHLPNFYEGYYDFNNGMKRFPNLKCYIPAEVIFKEYSGVKDKD